MNPLSRKISVLVLVGFLGEWMRFRAIWRVNSDRAKARKYSDAHGRPPDSQ